MNKKNLCSLVSILMIFSLLAGCEASIKDRNTIESKNKTPNPIETKNPDTKQTNNGKYLEKQFPSFEVYLVKDVELSDLKKMPLDEIPVEETPLITSKDKDFYVWKEKNNDKNQLRLSIYKKFFENRRFLEKPFVLVLNGKRQKWALFISMASSKTYEGVRIVPIYGDLIIIYDTFKIDGHIIVSPVVP